MIAYAVRVALSLAMAALPFGIARAADAQLDRGKYLVQIMGCTDCHTPGHFLGHPDAAKYLAGSDVGFGIPNAGVFVGPNLTPDNQTGLGKWSEQQIIAAITTGVRPDGRMLAPVMPWRGFANLTPADATALAAYLKSLPPISNQVPGPFGAAETPTVFVMSILPGPVYGGLPKPK
jgi:mono/diheme cytochrome c family protein